MTSCETDFVCLKFLSSTQVTVHLVLVRSYKAVRFPRALLSCRASPKRTVVLWMLEDSEETLDRELSMHSVATTVAQVCLPLRIPFVGRLTEMQSNGSSPRQIQSNPIKEDAHLDGWRQIR